MNGLLDSLLNLHSLVVYLIVAAVVFVEDALFVGFVVPGEMAAVLGGVAASRGNVSLPVLIVVVGVAWGIGMVLLGYLAGHSYAAIEKTFGRAIALVVTALILIALVVWRVRRRRERPDR